MNQINLHKLLFASLLLAAGIIVGAAVSTTNEAHGEIRGTPPPQAFQTGGQLSVPILREIATTLQQMDARLARLETVAQKLQTPRTGVQNGN